VLSDRIAQALSRGRACPELVKGFPHLPSGARLRNVVSLSLAALLALTSFSLAQKPKTPNPLAPKSQVAARPEQAPSTGTHELTAADLEAFLDGVMPLQLRREDIAGAVISVVKGGKLLFAKGYGFADVAKRTPVSPDSTLFRPGSISKLFTWTAVMQQVEQGKLDLDRDVNDYLDFKIPPAFGKPITLRIIMTHTPGFEETIQELFVGDEKHLTALGDYLKAHLPERIYPPGSTPAYSNYATAMAGYIVQRVSGEKFDDYIENHIFKPLGMNNCTFRQPLPESLKPQMSNGYEVASQPAHHFEFVNTEPAGSSSVTATDMARFMITHLQDGTYEGVQILRPETARLMHSRQFANLPEMNAMALGFYEETRNGHRIIGHGGDTQYFHSDLHLVPDLGLGFFISYNSAGNGEISARTAVWEKLLDRYFPYEPPAGAAVPSASADAQSVSGRYIVSRRADTTVMKVFNVLGQAKVFPNDDGTISVSDLKDLNGEPKKFKEIGPLLFRESNGQDKIGFKRDDSGRWVLVIDYPFMVFQKSPWNVNSALNLPIIIASMVIMALALLLWPVAALTRRHYGQKLTLTPRDKKLRLLVKIACALGLIFLAGFALFFSMAEKDIAIVSPSYNPVLRLLQLLGWLACIGALVSVYYAVLAWKDQSRWIGSKLVEIAVCLALLGFVWFVFTWNMLHLSLKY
jgi:CubicO group peptidase (beta-lactamase class C family)